MSETLVRELQEIGGPVSEFSLQLVEGGARDLRHYVNGKKGAVVVFWSGVCSHCVRYDAYLNDFTSRHPDIGLVAVASRHGETPEQIQGTIRERNLQFPIVYDPGSAVARQWYTQQTPRVFLIDSDLRLHYRGAIDNFKYAADPEYQAYLEPAIASFLAGEPLARNETASFGCAIQSVYYILPKPI
ncbi:MAG: redoxin domain-containing protein [Bryobacteraceae bacterium]